MIKRLELKLVKIFQSIVYFCAWLIQFLVFSAFFNIRVEGKEQIPKKGRFILAANHQNFYDGFFVAYTVGPFRKISFVIAKRALRMKIAQLYARSIGSVILSNSLEEYQRVLKKLNKTLSHGGRVGIFPEGDVSPRAIPRKFKGGVAKLSIDSKTKVVPIFLNGTYNLRHIKYWFGRHTIIIRVGKPVDLYNYADECSNDLDHIAGILREKIIELATLQETVNLDNSEDYNSVQFSYNTSIKEPVVKT